MPIKEIRSFVSIVIVLIIFSGCATNAGGYKKSDAVEKRLMELNKAQVASKLGAPTESVKLDNNHEVWTYRAKVDSLKGGDCVITVNIRDNQVIDAKVPTYPRIVDTVKLLNCCS